ncbi:early activation antigen CD69-like [Esox lucius]|uniref:early activation antigen CD69-like n=1 Tax=Esox lucius TaxID=8010 RepID=UPI0014775913|nr:early activation antigen CD69-like [Esox lucius]
MGVMTVSVFCILLTFLVTESFAVPGQKCKYGFSQPNPSWKSCYLLDQKLRSWSDAKELCLEKGGTLASIKNNEQLQYAYEMISDGYFWVDGNYVSGFPQKNWLPGSKPGGTHADCLTLVKFPAARGFSDIACSEKIDTAYALCESVVKY